ncbi:MAG: CvpA family protein [Thermoguttaceae bacterium]
MTWLFPLLLLILFLATALCLLTEGMWSNAIRFINVVFAALLATNFWEPTAKLLEGAMKGGSYWWDFVSLWVLFALFVTLLQMATNRISRVKVRFLAIANKVGGIAFACMVAAVLVSFANFTMHTAPLGEKPFQGGFPSSSSMSPDRQWVRFVSLVSGGSLARFGTSRPFSGSQFNEAYSARRRALQEQVMSGKGFGGDSAGSR